jgi:predicted RNase H-like HicB family nuclease
MDMQVNEFFLKLRIEPLEEGGFVATSRELPGLVAQGRTRAETVEIAQDVARKILELHVEKGIPLPPAIRKAMRLSRRATEAAIPVGVALQSA